MWSNPTKLWIDLKTGGIFNNLSLSLSCLRLMAIFVGRARCRTRDKLIQGLEIPAVSMANSLFVGSFQNYDLMLTALSIQLQLKFQRNLSLRIVELSELHEGSS